MSHPEEVLDVPVPRDRVTVAGGGVGAKLSKAGLEEDNCVGVCHDSGPFSSGPGPSPVPLMSL